ncbi:MAG: M3 family oligoendopeptidase [Candidatus Izimaplasma sp.]|nr:M3 family oligoendopeptidase [Candidatus Izimaplasma bacterium]
MKTWNLDALYESFEDESFQNDLQETKKLIDTLNEFAKKEFSNLEDPKQKIKAYLKQEEKLDHLVRKLYSFCSLTMSVDAKNKDAKKYLNNIQVALSKTTFASTRFSKWLPEVNNLDKLIQSDELLKEARFYLNRIVEGAKYVLSDQEEMVISKMKQTSSTAWSQLQGELTSTLKIEFDGEELSLSALRNKAYSKDPDIRKRAHDTLLDALPEITPSIAYAMNGVKGEVNNLSEMRGYDSPLDEAVFKSRMKRETLDTLLASMREYLPHFHQYIKRKAKLLGHEDGMPYYDLFAPLGESNREFSEEEAMTYIFKNFKTFSPKLENLAKRAWKESWIDFTPRNGKRGGAFCANLHPIKQSRILTNFTGSFSNVITLAHELGHAYHGDNIFSEKSFNSSYTMPVAETASTFCETIVKNAAINDANKEEKIFLLEQSLMGSTQVIVDILSRFIFEKNVFDKRLETPLNEDMLNDFMLDAQKEAYADSLDHDYLMPYAWVYKPHYYSGGLSYYNFPYAFGLLFAKGIYAKFKENGPAFAKDIDLLLEKTGQMTVEDVADLVDIDLNDKDFWRKSLDVIKEEIDLFLELTE